MRISPFRRTCGGQAWGSERELDKVAQFEMFGFVRIDGVGEKGCGVFYV